MKKGWKTDLKVDCFKNKNLGVTPPPGDNPEKPPKEEMQSNVFAFPLFVTIIYY